MRISRVKIRNFANFSALDVETGESIVIVGENKVGKSNFIRALQLILDPGLSERDRQLGLEHFWDGLGEDKIGEMTEISVDLTDFTGDPRLMAHLNDCVVDPGPPMVARLTYRFQPKANLGRDPESLTDYEYVIFGGDDPDMAIGSSFRRMLPLDVQVALRDAEKDLSSWRNSPLRPLIEQLATSLDEDARDVARALANTPTYERSRHRRKKVEMLFAHLKRILRLGRLRLRGPCGARDEFLLAATAQNLRKLAKLRSMTALA